MAAAADRRGDLICAMNIFAEYLGEWEFGEKWRPLVERLDERTNSWPTSLFAPDDFAVYDALGTADPVTLAITPGDGLLIWTDFSDNGTIQLSLGAQVDADGLRCGPIEPSRPDDPQNLTRLTWFTRSPEARSLSSLADDLLEWFVLEAERWRAWLDLKTEWV